MGTPSHPNSDLLLNYLSQIKCRLILSKHLLAYLAQRLLKRCLSGYGQIYSGIDRPADIVFQSGKLGFQDTFNGSALCRFLFAMPIPSITDKGNY